MARIAYITKRFSAANQAIVVMAHRILTEYAGKGMVMTLRQLYYQFVARGFIANNMKEYKHLGSVVNDARMAGLLDWDHLQDSTRELRKRSTWNDPADIIKAAAAGFGIDKWRGQEWRPEVWIEKDALVGVIERTCRSLDVAYFSCRGYVSQSEMWSAAAERIIPRWENDGQRTLILHFGDHDPSGIDMSRDIQDRLETFAIAHDAEECFEVQRIALTMKQVEQHKPPPNPAKLTDARAEGYVARFGDESWELDALSPEVLTGHIEAAVGAVLDKKLWVAREKEEATMRKNLERVSDRWSDVEAFIRKSKGA